MENIVQYVFGEAAKSNVEKRKVGCIIADANNNVVAKGHNRSIGFGEDGVHAEAMACEELMQVGNFGKHGPYTAYVSHPPCPECAQLFLDHDVVNVEVVEQFLKFDGDKLRYDLVPPKTVEALAEVLTMGARKYKPNNWRECKDLDRYVAAQMRHFEAYRRGEWLDPESGLPHLAHAMCNLSFLLELDEPSV